jgi:peroxiredoxin
MRAAFVVTVTFACSALVIAQRQQPAWSEQEKPISDQIRTLRQVSDDKRGAVTKDLALRIRALPADPNKLLLATSLANLSTEGDFGRDTLQEVATTLAGALREQAPAAAKSDGPYFTLAQLVRYEHVRVDLDDPQFKAALAQLEKADRQRQSATFSLADLEGKTWSLENLRGKIVLVNFWATWCPPCRKEMPDLQALYDEYKDKGLIVLAISDEDSAKVRQFIADKKYTYPILLDPGRKANEAFVVEGIPKSFVYDRTGKLVAYAIDMRTRGQFIEMLGRAGLR